jgi:spermidine synthase
MSTSFEILSYEETPLGTLCLRRRRLLGHRDTFVTEITLDHELLMSSHHTASERALASLAIAMHGGRDLTVLVGGLGLGYTAREVLKSPQVESVGVVEFLPQVIQWLNQDLFPLASQLADDGRFSVRHGDIYEMLARPPDQRHDLILIDVDHSPDDPLDEGAGFFYTRDGLGLAKQHLAPHGVLAVWSYEKSSPFASALREVFEEVRIEEISFENELIDQVSTDLLFLARG